MFIESSWRNIYAHAKGVATVVDRTTLSKRACVTVDKMPWRKTNGIPRNQTTDKRRTVYLNFEPKKCSAVNGDKEREVQWPGNLRVKRRKTSDEVDRNKNRCQLHIKKTGVKS